MLLFVIAYLGGVLTILSPCILPVLPFVFARADKSFMRDTLPLLAGMTITFALVASLATVGGNWAVNTNEYGRYLAMIVLTFFAVTLLVPSIAEWATRPLVALGGRLSQSADENKDSGIWASVLLGVATRLLWTPCAGPILGLVLTGAALRGPNAGTSVLLFSYALGAATSLAFALFAGGRIFAAMKKSLGAEEWIRRGLGVAVLASVVAIAAGLDTGFLAQLSATSTTWLEGNLVNQIPGNKVMMGGGSMTGNTAMMSASVESPTGAPQRLAGLVGAKEWINSPPLTAESLRGEVVLIDFWTYSCINCLRSMPYLRSWAAKYKDHGLVVIGVHTPEFAFERNIDNVRRAVRNLGIAYPVATDNDYAVWRAFDNDAWPAHYLLDGMGRLITMHLGEGQYQEFEAAIQAALTDNGDKNVPGSYIDAKGGGIEEADAFDEIDSPETYIGYQRVQNFVSPGGQLHDAEKDYSSPASLAMDQWGLTGSWTVDAESATLGKAPGRIAFHFRARDLHLVLGPAAGGKPVRFRVLLDGKPPGKNHGVDADARGEGVVTEQRLYQLVRQSDDIRDPVFTIEFLDPGVQAFSFTFG